MKETHPVNWMSDHISAHSFFVNAHGELIAEQKPVTIIVPQVEYRQLELSL